LVLALCLLGAGCSLDQSPLGASGNSGQGVTVDQTGKRGFTPRDPGRSNVQSDSADAGAQTPATDPTDNNSATLDASTPTTPPRAGARAPQAPRSDDDAAAPAAPRDAAVPPQQPAQDAGVPAVVDAAVPAPDAAPASTDSGVVVDAAPPAVPAPPSPTHRYDFSGTGRVADDLIGTADAELQGRAFMAGGGSVMIGNTNEDAVDLPTGILAGHTSFTILGWLETRTMDCAQTLFVFGYYREGQRNSQQLSALYLTPFTCPGGGPSVNYLTERSNQSVAAPALTTPIGTQVMLGAMYDGTTEELSLIVDGVVVQRETVPLQMRELSRALASLGRSNNQNERPLGGSISEFRMYDRTLDDATLAEIARRGPDQL
jgi:hypothetical protein